ncbi:MAG: RagB/SusD family nutrient uptake outer membrane protein [Bacteroidales bacterium]|nr:RagB/SusD family nutrient uptake outer membrane protein [Bacteroidales bacterium]
MKKILYIILTAAAFVSTVGCNFLDQEPDDLITEEMVFNDIVKTNGWLANIYNYLPDPYMGWNMKYGLNTLVDDVQIPLEWSGFGWWTASAMKGNWSATSNYFDLWGDVYKAVRAAYVFLEKVKPLGSEQTEEDVAYMKLQARFLIAYYYSELLEFYGSFPLVTRYYGIDSTYEELMLERTPFETIVEWLDEELLDLSKNLPLKHQNVSEDFGRATKGMALAVRAHVHMLAASPLFNGNKLYAEVKNHDGTLLFPQTYDKDKWKRAADAIKDLLDLGVYSLYKEYNEDGTLDPFLSYMNLHFALGDANPELIFINNNCNYAEADQNMAPHGYGDGNGAYGATQNLVDAFFTRNGLPIDKDPSYKADGYSTEDIRYPNTAWVRSNSKEEPGLVTEAGTPNMYCNREPRFYVSILWHGEWSSQMGGFVNFLYGGPNGGPSYDSPQCGYLMRKRQHPQSTEIGNQNHPYRPGIIFRLGEFYLSYAEALNEFYGESQQQEVLKYLNAIRERAGIPAYEGTYTQSEMRDMIRRERRIELLDEGKRYTDLRRWMLSKEVLSKPIRGLNVKSTTPDQFFFQTRTFMIRSFEDRNYLWPIRQTYIDNNPKLVQNYGF